MTCHVLIEINARQTNCVHEGIIILRKWHNWFIEQGYQKAGQDSNEHEDIKNNFRVGWPRPIKPNNQQGNKEELVLCRDVPKPRKTLVLWVRVNISPRKHIADHQSISPPPLRAASNDFLSQIVPNRTWTDKSQPRLRS